MSHDPMLTDDDISRQLSGEATRGPRTFRGQLLAPLTRGLRDLRNKLVAPDDTATFHDALLLHLLAAAHAETPAARLERRQALLLATDDVAAFRGAINLALDDFSDEDAAEAKRLTNEILGLVEAAEVVLAEKKSAPPAAPVPSPMTTPSSSPPSPAKPRGRRTSSAGS